MFNPPLPPSCNLQKIFPIILYSSYRFPHPPSLPSVHQLEPPFASSDCYKFMPSHQILAHSAQQSRESLGLLLPSQHRSTDTQLQSCYFIFAWITWRSKPLNLFRHRRLFLYHSANSSGSASITDVFKFSKWKLHTCRREKLKLLMSLNSRTVRYTFAGIKGLMGEWESFFSALQNVYLQLATALNKKGVLKKHSTKCKFCIRTAG